MSYDVYFVRRHPPQDFEGVPENEHPLKESSDLRSRLVADMNTPRFSRARTAPGNSPTPLPLRR
ncbi:hypothetical protein L830_1845 [Mycobacteroides abscessus MAB_082312_2258]|nr:hypothetical protein L830_1845 [Mycobacteroides abscessus MAB_082312_2258]